MEAEDFDHLTRLLGRAAARRRILSGLALSPFAGLGAARTADHVDARNRHKKRKKPPAPVPNAFGCLDVGQPCRGNDSLCCSGVCRGRKPKKGKKDTRTCAAHHAGNCSLERDLCVVENAPVNSLCNVPDEYAFCLVTTGNAPFCGSALGFQPEIHCQACRKDADCLALGFPPGSACVLHGGRCNSCESTDNRACMAPAIPA